jgi:hypothetical protein
MNTALTALETAVMQLVADQHWPGFCLDQLEVSRRECTGVGRYAHFLDRAKQHLPDGSYAADAHFIEMDGVPNGLFFTVEVANGSISYLELVSCGADSWDGVERAWSIV